MGATINCRECGAAFATPNAEDQIEACVDHQLTREQRAFWDQLQHGDSITGPVEQIDDGAVYVPTETGGVVIDADGETHDPVELENGSTVILKVSGRLVAVHAFYDPDDGDSIGLDPLNCNLEGETPGHYYLAARGESLKVSA
jgi:hypothetical protein